ncbi:MAG TPA: DedA family protein [Candidatus Saccharimonadales bacterium]|nr:DedA family protein [Candidatus Saccharimonadales bacterium]
MPFSSIFNTEHIVQTGGLLVVTLMIFAESGLLIGIILPGDSLLLVAGLFAGRGKLNIWLLVTLVIIAAIIGYQVGYYFGERIGPRLFKRKNGFLFREEYLGRTEKFFDKYGPVTVIAARFIAHVRTLVSLIAGASNMNRRRYFIYNVIGAVIWGGGLTLLGYWLGANVPNIDTYIIPAVLATLIILYGFTIWQLTKSPERRRNLRTGLREDWNYFFKKDT